MGAYEKAIWQEGADQGGWKLIPFRESQLRRWQRREQFLLEDGYAWDVQGKWYDPSGNQIFNSHSISFFHHHWPDWTTSYREQLQQKVDIKRQKRGR